MINYVAEHKAVFVQAVSSLLLLVTSRVEVIDTYIRWGTSISGIILAIATVVKILYDLKIKFEDRNHKNNA